MTSSSGLLSQGPRMVIARLAAAVAGARGCRCAPRRSPSRRCRWGGRASSSPLSVGGAGVQVLVALAGRLVLEVLAQVAHGAGLLDRLAVGRDLDRQDAAGARRCLASIDAAWRRAAAAGLLAQHREAELDGVGELLALVGLEVGGAVHRVLGLRRLLLGQVGEEPRHRAARLGEGRQPGAVGRELVAGHATPRICCSRRSGLRARSASSRAARSASQVKAAGCGAAGRAGCR